MTDESPSSINEIDADALFLQVRTAHRLLAAYYQRLLPTIEKIAVDVNADYWFWETCRFSKTARNPFDSWKWDMLPASIPRYVFKSVESLTSVKKDDFILEFIVINDTGVRDENKKYEPDALNIKVDVVQAKSILKINIYRAFLDQEQSFSSCWNKASYPKINNDSICELDKGFVTTAFEVSLANLVTENGVLALKERINICLKATLDFKQ